MKAGFLHFVYFIGDFEMPIKANSVIRKRDDQRVTRAFRIRATDVVKPAVGKALEVELGVVIGEIGWRRIFSLLILFRKNT